MSQDALQSLIESHITRYPAMLITDVYKLLHQATFGSSEAVSKRKSAQEWLEHELSINAPNPNEPLLESVSLDDSIFRLNLRAYQAAGGKPKNLLDATINSVGAVTGSAETMAARWAVFTAMVEAGHFDTEQLPPREVHLFGNVYAAQGWSVSQHSPEYLRAYRPAYRVLTAAEAQKLIEKQGIAYSV